MIDVLIIGGGFSGVAAAKKLHESGKTFQLIEARERLGGRVHTERFDEGLWLDLGGQWIGPTQDRMYELVREFDLKLFETYNEGINLLDLKGKIRKYTGLIPKMDPVSLVNLEMMIRKMEAMARKIDSASPWSNLKASKWDRMTLEQFVNRSSWTSAAYQVMKAGLETVYACEMNEISLLHALFYIKSGTSLDCLLNIKEGAQQHRIDGGMQRLVEEMAKPFQNKISVNEPILTISWNGEVKVSTPKGEYSAKKLILAVPPSVAQKIQFIPELPTRKKQVLERIPMGIAGKVLSVYEKPFWRSAGFSGQVVADDNTPFQTFFDVSPPDESYGVLLAFTLANRARDFFSLQDSEREALAISYFGQYFGAEAQKPLRYVDHNWVDEPWSMGCYAGIYGTGTWTNFQKSLAEPTGPIHWAGTETSDIWFGYIEGAVRAGERAASEIIDQHV